MKVDSHDISLKSDTKNSAAGFQMKLSGSRQKFITICIKSWRFHLDCTMKHLCYLNYGNAAANMQNNQILMRINVKITISYVCFEDIF